MTNTEKPTTKAESKKQGIVNSVKVETSKVNQKRIKKQEVKPLAASSTIQSKEKQEIKEKESPSKLGQSEEPEKKLVEKKKQEKTRKTEAIVKAENLPLSTKMCAAVCRFIKGKNLGKAIRDLEEVSTMKKAVPVKGEYAHRKGKIMSGKYPQKTAKIFIVVLKSLASNAADISEPIISEAVANIGVRPHGRFGRIRRKRTHLIIKVKEKKELKKKIKKNFKYNNPKELKKNGRKTNY